MTDHPAEDHHLDDDYNDNPMLYDALCELATRIGGRYVYWMRSAETEAEREHWFAECIRVNREARAVDPYSISAVTAKRAELRALFASMPDEAPPLR